MNITLKPAGSIHNRARTRTVNPWTWQDQFGYSQALETMAKQRVLYCAGQVSGDMAAQIQQAMDNLETVLTRAEYSLADVVRLTIYTTDVDALFESYGEIVGRLASVDAQPPITLLGVTRLAFPELMVEIEATAAK
jgi:enamine deaminase RidA (YjgF/YER057c/UK114 family)